MRYVVATLVLVVSGLVFHAVAAEKPRSAAMLALAPDDADQGEAADLKKRIDDLQAELNRLKQRLKSLESKRRVLTIPAPSPRPSTKPVPPEWQRREFNGQEYFIVPLAKEPAGQRD